MITKIFEDKSQWGDGPWKNEADKYQWDHDGFDCLIVRNNIGVLCGYVGVSKDHPYYKISYEELENLDVHGGLTFSDLCLIGGKICHENGVNESVWWLGFDTAHMGDLIPKADHLFSYFNTIDNPNIYKDFNYVKNEVENLAKQLGEIK